jgi:hypothetical protein
MAALSAPSEYLGTVIDFAIWRTGNSHANCAGGISSDAMKGRYSPAECIGTRKTN